MLIWALLFIEGKKINYKNLPNCKSASAKSRHERIKTDPARKWGPKYKDREKTDTSAQQHLGSTRPGAKGTASPEVSKGTWQGRSRTDLSGVQAEWRQDHPRDKGKGSVFGSG